LRRTLASLFAEAVTDATIDPVGIVSPHAGYVYSGRTAARGYKLLEGRHYDRVIIIAPSHFTAFPGASVFEGKAFATPLGLIPVDSDFVDRLRGETGLFGYYPEAERREHSLEVQLPFLQHVLGDFVLVPVLMCDRSYENCLRIAQKLAAALVGDCARTLVVASSDLYHGPGNSRARDKSALAARAIERFAPVEFCAGIEGEEFQACGAGPVAAAMALSRDLGATRGKVLALTTSFEEHPGREDYVVGYLSAVFCK
jgi:hypothetical protein